MSVTTYTELVAALDGQTGYLHRTDLTAKISDFIKLAESRINRKLRVLLQETEATLTATGSSRLMAQPSDFAQPIALWLTTYLPRIELTYRNPESLPVNNSNGSSQYYTVDGTNIATENPADQAYTYTLRYLKSFNLQSTSTNTVLTDFPDIYIYGTLAAAVLFTQQFDKLQVFNDLFDRGIKEAISDTNATKSKANLRTEFSHDRPNIFRGY